MANIENNDLYAIQELAEKYAKKELEPNVLKRDNYPFEPFDKNAVKVAGETGLLGMMLPEELGGTDQGARALAAIIEVVARKDAGIAAVILAQSFATKVVATLGGKDAAAKWIPESGVKLIASPLYADPENLPDDVTAQENGGNYILSGEFPYLALLPEAEAAIIPAALGANKFGFFVVDLKSEGVVKSAPVVSLGLKAFPVGDLELKKVSVPKANRIGADDAALKYADIAELFRGPIAALALGVIHGSYCTARDYAAERFQGKKQIIDHDMVRRMLSQMATAIDTGSALVAQACTMADAGVSCSNSMIVSVQQHITSEAARATTDGVQLLGGYGYMKDYGQEKRMRDAKQIQAMFGSSPTRVQRIIERRIATEIR